MDILVILKKLKDNKHKLYLIEDCAEAIGSKINGVKLELFQILAFSVFMETKL